MAMLNLF